MLTRDFLKIKNIVFISAVSLVPLLITGPFLPDLFLVLGSLALLFTIFKNKNYKIYNNIYLWFFISFYLVLLVSSLFSQDIFHSFESSLFYFRFFFILLIFNFCFLNFNNFKLIFFYTLLILFVILYFDSLIQIITGENLLGFKKFENDWRISSFFGDDLKLGSFLSRIFPILILSSFAMSNINKSIFFIFFFIVTLIFTIFTGERSAIIILLTFFTIIFIFSKKLIKLNYKLIIITILFTAIFFQSYSNFFKTIFFSQAYDRVINQTIEQYNHLIQPDEIENKVFKNITESHHLAIYTTAYKIFLDNKIIGAGPKMFRKLCSKPEYLSYYIVKPEARKRLYYDERQPLRWLESGKNDANVDRSLSDLFRNGCQTHPHHTYIQILSETGILGTLFIFSLYLILIFIFIKTQIYDFITKRKENDILLIILTCILINFNPILPSGNFFNNWLSIVYYLPIAYLYNYKHIK